MIDVSTDRSKNLLTFRFRGRVGAEELIGHRERTESLLAELPPGFQLLSDLSGLESMDPACAAEIERTMDLCDQKGVKRVVRVIPDPQKDIGLNIMSLFHYRRGLPIVTCETLEQAEEILAG